MAFKGPASVSASMLAFLAWAGNSCHMSDLGSLAPVDGGVSLNCAVIEFKMEVDKKGYN